MPPGEKNQAMKSLNALPTVDRIDWPNRLLFGLILTSWLWGCTVAPTKKLLVEDISKSFEEGVIISTGMGEPIDIGDLINDLNSCQIVYVGEKHTNSAHHQIQLQIIRELYKDNPNLTVGMEMFDYTYQDVLERWSQGELSQEEFLRKSHWYANWRYDFSLYQDILEFIKDHNIRLVGLNIPSYIPPRIREGGIKNLRDVDKAHLPPQIDTSNTAHRDFLKKIFEGHKHHFKREVKFEDFYAAQSVWEDAMAEKIAQNLNDSNMVVLAGNGHIQYKYGIPDRAFKQTGACFRTVYLEPVGSGKVESDIADYIWVTE